MAEEANKKVLKDVEEFDHANLKQVEEKPTTPSQTRDMTLAGIGSDDHRSSP